MLFWNKVLYIYWAESDKWWWVLAILHKPSPVWWPITDRVYWTTLRACYTGISFTHFNFGWEYFISRVIIIKGVCYVRFPLLKKSVRILCALFNCLSYDSHFVSSEISVIFQLLNNLTNKTWRISHTIPEFLKSHVILVWPTWPTFYKMWLLLFYIW